MNANPAGAAGTAVHVIGATGRTGAVLCRMLAARGTPVVAVVRDLGRWKALGIAGDARQGDLRDPAAMLAALEGASRVVSVSFAAWTDVVMAAAPAAARLVVTGTARRYGGVADAAGDAARLAEALILDSGRDAAILHPTMIYGAAEDGTVRRLAALVARWPILAWPEGGRRLVQPVHVADVAASLIAALDRRWVAPAAVAVGGPEPVCIAALLEAVAAATGKRRPVILPVPEALVRLVGRLRPGLLRLLEDRVVDIAGMRAELRVAPRDLARGLHETFGG